MHKLLIRTLTPLPFVAVSLLALAPATDSNARNIMEAFVKLDVTGARLTPQGWSHAESLFTEHSSAPQSETVIIIAPHYGVSRETERETSATFYFGYEELGKIDGLLRFRSSRTALETRSMIKYTLVLVKKEDSLRARTGSSRDMWRIQGSQPPEMHLTLEAAKKYVSEMRDKAHDRRLKENAVKTLSMLQAYE